MALVPGRRDFGRAACAFAPPLAFKALPLSGGAPAARPVAPTLGSPCAQFWAEAGRPSFLYFPHPVPCRRTEERKEEDYGREGPTGPHRVRARREAHPPHLREGRGLADHHVGRGSCGCGLCAERPRREGRAGRDRPGGRPRGGLHLQERLLLGELHLALPPARPREGRQDLHRHPGPDARARRLRQLLPALHRPGHPHP